MKNRMIKKFDYCFIIIFIAVLIFLFIVLNKYNKYNNPNIQIIYRNELIIETNLEIENKYCIKSNKDLNMIMIYKNDILIDEVEMYLNIDIFYCIEILNKKVKVVEANCKNKDCMNMYIDEHHIFPIICIDGLIIKVSNNDNSVDIVS